MVWLQPNASRAYSDDMPTMSQKPWMKNANSTALAQNSCFAFMLCCLLMFLHVCHDVSTLLLMNIRK